MILALLVGALLGTSAAPWLQVEPGVEYGRFRLGEGDSVAHVVRVDPRLARVEVHTVEDGEEPLGIRGWGESRSLVFAANAGMFAEDRRTHIGYFKVRGRELVPHIHPQYKSALLLHPLEPHLPPARLLDIDEEPLERWRDRYATVVQNLRLIKAPGENRWSAAPRKWSEMALGEDDAGRLLFLFTQVPLDMADWNERVLALPLSLRAAQHLEGGREARFFLRLDGEDMVRTGGWLGAGTGIPSIIGVRSSKKE